MDAEEARAISDRVAAKRVLGLYLDAVKSAAERGEYQWNFRDLEGNEINAFKRLGFKVTDISGGVQVSWEAT